MRIRTLALALALACGTTVMAEANQAKKPVIHRTAKKGTPRKSRNSRVVKARKAKRGKTLRSSR